MDCSKDGGMLLGWVAYHALHVADEHAVVEEGARFIAVADVVEGFGAVLAGEIEEDFLTTTVGFVSWLILGLDLGLVKQCEREDSRLRWPFFSSCFSFRFCFFFPSVRLSLSLVLLASGIGTLDSVAMGRYGKNVRVLIGECGAVVDLVVNDKVEILLGAVLGDLLEGELLDFRHGELRYLNNIADVSWGSVKTK